MTQSELKKALDKINETHKSKWHFLYKDGRDSEFYLEAKQFVEERPWVGPMLETIFFDTTGLTFYIKIQEDFELSCFNGRYVSISKDFSHLKEENKKYFYNIMRYIYSGPPASDEDYKEYFKWKELSKKYPV